MPHEADFRRASNVFKVLSHPGRLRIICSMMDGNTTTQADLIKGLGWPQSTVNRHLTVLRDAGLVVARRGGTRVNLELEGEVTNNLLHAVCDWVHPETGESMSGHLKEILTTASVSNDKEGGLR